MKDEEMAEEYAKEKLSEEDYKLSEEVIKPIYHNAIKNDYSFAKYGVECYLAGLKAGRPQWQKPEETIDKDKVVLGHIKLCNKDRYSLVQWNGEWWYQYGTFNAEVRLIEWCEIPTFDKE